ncbi:MAG: ACT domain-containing protein [Clostridiales bacterium]|nr:ACT domain-containing protein [Clostridiales bacterium]
MNFPWVLPMQMEKGILSEELGVRSEELEIRLLGERLQIVRLPVGASIPPEVWSGELCCVTQTPDELSLVVAEAVWDWCQGDGSPDTAVSERTVPADTPADTFIEKGWRAFQIVGQLDFGLVGVIARVSALLAAQDIPIFVVSTYNTDYILIKENNVPKAVDALRSCYTVSQ